MPTSKNVLSELCPHARYCLLLFHCKQSCSVVFICRCADPLFGLFGQSCPPKIEHMIPPAKPYGYNHFIATEKRNQSRPNPPHKFPHTKKEGRWPSLKTGCVGRFSLLLMCLAIERGFPLSWKAFQSFYAVVWRTAPRKKQ